MRIGIIGAGALGCLYGALLSRAGNEVTLVHRDSIVVSAIRRRGVTVREGNRSITASLSAEPSPADLSHAELVMFTVKSYDTEEAAETHKARITAGAAILTLQNGLNNVNLLNRVFRRQLVLGGATTEASLSVGPGRVLHTGRGRTWIGELGNSHTRRSSGIAREFLKAGFRTTVTRNVQGVLWSKTIVNAAINPFSALTGMRNGLLAKLPEIRTSMLRVVDEGIAVSQAEHVMLEPPSPGQLLLSVLRKTERNKSSMLQDVERNRRTEIRDLNGAIVGYGLKHKVPVPLNQLLTALVLGLEGAKSDSHRGLLV